MARRNMGKIKHYRRSFYTGGQRVRSIAGTLAILAALFLIGWLAGPAVIDFGTSTWYRIKRGADSKPAQSEAVQPQPTAQPAPTEEPVPEPVVVPETKPGEGGWAFVSVTAARTAEQAAETAAQLAAQGVKYAVIPFKDEQGYVYYDSKVEAARGAISSTVFDPAAAARAFEAQGITPVASISAFKDPIAPGANRTMAVMYQDTDYLWLDAARDQGGKPWLNPGSPEAIRYISDLIAEAKSLGYPEVWLTGLQFPPTPGRNQASFGDLGGRSMARILADALDAFEEQAVCWVEYPLDQAALGAESKLTGGTPAELGIDRLVLRADEIPDPEVLTQVVTAAKDGGVSVVALLEGNQITLQ